jgi:glycosyltransferase involved in cell wall biosynthesis
MRVYCTMETFPSRAMTRVAQALIRYAGRNIQFVSSETEADFVVLHVIGYPETLAAVSRIRQRGQAYAIVQYCMRSTQCPHTFAWKDIWQGAIAVWSYYDLKVLQAEDDTSFDFPFYLAPLGIDDAFRAAAHSSRPYTVFTSGYIASSETVLEVVEAARRVNGRSYHLGPRIAPVTAHGMGMPDDALARIYSQCKWVSGLRRCEGFEFPALEGLACRARPILYDQPHYRLWYENWGEFIPEVSDFEETVENVVHVFKSGFDLITEEERKQILEQFNWEQIIRGFWLAVGAAAHV